MTIRIIKHGAVPNTGSFENLIPDGRPSVYFYWDDIPRGSSPEQMAPCVHLSKVQSVDQRMRLGMRCRLSPTADVPSHTSGVHLRKS